MKSLSFLELLSLGDLMGGIWFGSSEGWEGLRKQVAPYDGNGHKNINKFVCRLIIWDEIDSQPKKERTDEMADRSWLLITKEEILCMTFY